MRVVISSLILKHIWLYNNYSRWVRALGCNDINVRIILVSMRDELARSKLLQRRTCMNLYPLDRLHSSHATDTAASYGPGSEPPVLDSNRLA